MARLDRELEVINKLGFANYFLIVWDFVRFARQHGHPGHGPRFGRRLAGFLRPGFEPRLPAEIRPAVRAVSGRKPPRGPRYRHRLLPGSAGRGDPVRQGQVRHGERGPDRHVRHAGGPGGHSRRGPGAGPAHPARRLDRGPGARGTAHHARKGPGKKRRPEKGLRRRPRSPRADRPGDEDRGPRPQRRHARRGRGDRRSAAGRIRPLAARAGQRRSHHPVGDGRRRAGRPVEDGFPRPAQPDDPLQGGRADRANDRARRSIPTSSRSTTRKRSPCSAAARPRASSSSKAAAFATCCSR